MGTESDKMASCVHLMLLLSSVSIHLASGCLPPSSDCGQWKCGRKNEGNKRIVGGRDADRNEYPWQVAIIEKTKPDDVWCGGSLITPWSVLTAAHCQFDCDIFTRICKKIEHDKLLVSVGKHTRMRDSSEQRIAIEDWINHQSYNGIQADEHDLDFAIIKLAKRVTLSDKISPVCLPSSRDTIYAEEIATVTGWGTQTFGLTDYPSVLQEVEVAWMSPEECRKTDFTNDEITDNMICARFPGKDACQGDSGGPLIAISPQDKPRKIYDQIGVVSWGKLCAKWNLPGVYSRVTKQLAWIRSHMKGK